VYYVGLLEPVFTSPIPGHLGSAGASFISKLVGFLLVPFAYQETSVALTYLDMDFSSRLEIKLIT